MTIAPSLTLVYVPHSLVLNKISTCRLLNVFVCFCLYAACDQNCANGCSITGVGKCDTACVANYFLNSAYQCSRELLCHVLSGILTEL